MLYIDDAESEDEASVVDKEGGPGGVFGEKVDVNDVGADADLCYCLLQGQYGWLWSKEREDRAERLDVHLQSRN